MSGAEFLETLERLEYPGLERLDRTSVDWLFEEEGIAPLLDWFCANIQAANVLQPRELQEFEQLQSSAEGILEGSRLEEVLHNLSLTSDDHLSEDQLEDEIEQLRNELTANRSRKDMYAQQRLKLSSHQSRLNDRLGGMDKVEAVAKQKYRQCFNESQSDNLKMNTALDELAESMQRLMGLYLAGGGPPGKQSEEAVFLSHLQLEAYYQAEQRFTQELTAFTKKQFFEGIADMVGNTQDSQYELLEVSNPVSLLVSGEREGINMDDCKELGRLQLLYLQTESDRINALLESRCTTAACQYAEDRLNSVRIKPYPQNIKELSAKLQDAETSLSLMKRDLAILGAKVPALIKDSASLQEAKVLRGDYILKMARQDYFSSKQQQVIDQLVKQRARNEYLTMAYELELKSHHNTKRLFTATTMLLQSSISAMVERMKMMEESSQIPSKYKRGTVDSRDKFVTRLHHLLNPNGTSSKQQIFLTYQELAENADKLHHQVDKARTASISNNSNNDDRLTLLEGNMKLCQSVLFSESSTVGGLPALTPLPLADLLTQLNEMLKKLEVAVMDIIKDVDSKKKKLKMDPLQVMERELFVQFFTNPDQLRRSLDEVTSRLQAMM